VFNHFEHGDIALPVAPPRRRKGAPLCPSVYHCDHWRFPWTH